MMNLEKNETYKMTTFGNNLMKIFILSLCINLLINHKQKQK